MTGWKKKVEGRASGKSTNRKTTVPFESGYPPEEQELTRDETKGSGVHAESLALQEQRIPYDCSSKDDCFFSWPRLLLQRFIRYQCLDGRYGVRTWILNQKTASRTIPTT
jgi:hypothetical protein